MGKRVAKAKLRLVKIEREWVFTVEASSFRLSGVKTPALLTREDDEPLFERLYLIDELERALFGIYRLFLQERLDADWEKQRVEIAEWIARPVGPGA